MSVDLYSIRIVQEFKQLISRVTWLIKPIASNRLRIDPQNVLIEEVHRQHAEAVGHRDGERLVQRCV